MPNSVPIVFVSDNFQRAKVLYTPVSSGQVGSIRSFQKIING